MYLRSIALIILLGLCSRCAHAQGGSDEAMQRYSDDGQKALAAGQYDVAERDFLALDRLEPGIAEVHATLGLIYFQEKKFDRAVSEIRLAQKLKPGLSKLDSLLAMSLSELGQFEQALPSLESCFRESPDPAVKRMCGLQLLRADTGLHHDQEAVEIALQLDQAYPQDPEILYNTGKVYGNYAFVTIRKLAQDAPNSVWRHLAAAEAYESQGSWNQAIGEYKAVLAIDPHRSGIHYRIGRTLLAQSHQTGNKASVDEARTEFEAELQLDPRNGNAAYEIAEMHRQSGELELAAQYFERALKEYPNFEEALVGLAAVFLAEQKPQQAVQPLHAAIALNPDDEVSWYRLSQAEKALGDRAAQEDAMAHFKTLHQQALDQDAVRLAPASEVTRQETGPANTE